MPESHRHFSRTKDGRRKLRKPLVGLGFFLIFIFFVSVLTTEDHDSHRSSLLSIRRSIQSWTNNEIDSSNFTLSIESILQDQNITIASEIKGYVFPKGTKSLADLVPAMGGIPMRNIVVTTWRSGSTFVGQILNSIPGNYYHYEPLLPWGIKQIRGPPLEQEALNHLRSLLTCDYSQMDSYLEYGLTHSWLLSHNVRLWARCQEHPVLCRHKKFLSSYCALFPFQSMKVVRMRLGLLEPLLEDPELRVRVLLLVRDPRGTMQSRNHRDWCPAFPDCADPAYLCADLVADYSTALRFANKYPNRFRVLRYEDLSINPYQEAQKLLKFFGLEMHSSVKKFLDTHTRSNAGGVSSTFRNSKQAPFHWRQDLTHKEVRAIQSKCGPALKTWGYVVAHNASHQAKFNPVAPHFKLT